LSLFVCLLQLFNSCTFSDYLLVGYEGVSKSFQTGRLGLELQMVQLSATRCSCIAIFTSLVSLTAITLCVASQRVFVVVVVVVVVAAV